MYSQLAIETLLINSNISKKKKARLQNDIRFSQIFFRLYEMAMDSRYSFKNLPQSMNERVLKESLLWNGFACIYNENGNMINLPAALGDQMTIYGDFSNAYVYSMNGQINKRVSLYIPGTEYMEQDGKPNHGVIIRENNSLFPFIETVFYYATAIADTYRTIDVVRKNVKIPAIIACDPKIIPSVNKLFNDRDENQEYLAISTTFPLDKISTIPFAQDAAGAISSLTALIDWLESKFRTECGITANEAIDKKGENLLNEEVTINEEYTDSNTNRLVEELNRGLKDVNKIFGTNILAVEPSYNIHTEEREEENKNEEVSR